MDGGGGERHDGRASSASDHSGTGPKDPVVILGSGILGSTPFERHTDRYGTVHLTILDSVPGETPPARTVLVPGTTSRIVAWDHAPLGVAGTLVAHIIATTHNRDIWGQLPKPGERIVLGSGTLFTESYAGAPVIGVNPADGRETDWMNCDAIGRCRDQLVRLAFEVPEAGQPALPAIRRAQRISPAGPLADRSFPPSAAPRSRGSAAARPRPRGQGNGKRAPGRRM